MGDYLYFGLKFIDKCFIELRKRKEWKIQRRIRHWKIQRRMNYDITHYRIHT